MEEKIKNCSDQFAVCASDLGPSDTHIFQHHRHQPQWLLSTVAEMDRKTDLILDALIVEEDHHKFKSPQLIQSVVPDLQTSYNTLSNKFSDTSFMPPNQTSQMTKEPEDEDHRALKYSMMTAMNRFEMWDEIFELLEENLRQKEELIRRNDEKRECIKRLGLRLDQLQKENTRLKQSSSSVHDVELDKKKQYLSITRQMSNRLKGSFLNKIKKWLL